MSLYLTEIGIEHERVFMDTGWEHAATYDYLRGELSRVLGPIREIRGEYDMVSLLRKKAMFPSRLRRFCTTELKIRPMIDYLSSLDCDVVNAVGIRAAESGARAKLAEREYSDAFDCEVWRPILSWPEQAVIDIHHRHGLMPNPLYLKGASRVGCWPCINARKREVRLLADIDPDRVAVIRGMEEELTARAGAPRTWFHAHEPGALRPVNIDTAIEWARTDRGGRQYPLFDLEEPGCVRWGLCGADDSPEAA